MDINIITNAFNDKSSLGYNYDYTRILILYAIHYIIILIFNLNGMLSFKSFSSKFLFLLSDVNIEQR